MNLQQNSESINDTLYDIRAEYIISCLLKAGLSRDDILAVYEGPLKRRWSTDICYSEVESFESGDESLTIRLNRSGIYDNLPEAFFHDNPDKGNTTGKEMAKDSMKLKTEEKQIRLFFRPIENEFFLQNVRVATCESRELQSINFEFLNGLIPGFWKVDEKIPVKYKAKLIKLLPITSKILGNYKITARCLEKILIEKVTMEFINHDPDVLDSNLPGPSLKGFSLGRAKLGKDTVLHGRAGGFIGKLLVKIGPVENTAIKDFFNNGPADCLLRSFYSYFIPVELDVETKLITDKKQSRFILNPAFETGNSFLGYNTVL